MKSRLEVMVESQKLDIVQARHIIEDYRTAQAVAVLKRFDLFTVDASPVTAESDSHAAKDKQHALADDAPVPRRTASAVAEKLRVRDVLNFMPFMRTVSVVFSLTGRQLLQLLQDLPDQGDAKTPHRLRCVLKLLVGCTRAMMLQITRTHQ